MSRAEAATPEQANERSAKLADQFIMDMHTHFAQAGLTRDAARHSSLIPAALTIGP
ncbi:MAG TPA: hypothetical protein VFU71_00240 [Burkholderiaceae bacterium]|nr:hypothetical protein [Burkholderiaceae bacterium]